jgi:thiol-disulfide isomerase/thioredoxin
MNPSRSNTPKRLRSSLSLAGSKAASRGLGLVLSLSLLFAGAACRLEGGMKGDVKIIAHGEKVDVATHLAAGKHTVVDFYAAWCPPCRVMGPALERLAADEPDRFAVRKVDVVDWTMPVVNQYGIEALPHLMLFDPSGKKIAEGDDVFPELSRLFGEHARGVVAAAGGGSDTPATATTADGKQAL